MKGPLNAGREVAKALQIIDRSQLPSPIVARLRTVVRESGLQGEALLDVTRELVTHFEDGLSAGRSPDELARDFGDERVAASLIAREKRRADPDVRDRSVVRGGGGDPVLSRLGRNLKYAVRRAVQSPGFTLTAVASLAIGIGANTAIFTLVQRILWDAPPYEEPGRLVEAYLSSSDLSFTVMAYPELMAFREGTAEAFSGVAASALSFVQLEEGGRAELHMTELVSANYFETLGIDAVAGRLMQESDEDGRTADPVAVLSHGFWQETYGGDPAVVGTEIQLSGRAYTILGVTAPEFVGSFRGLTPDVYLPLLLTEWLAPEAVSPVDNWADHNLFVKARLRPGATIEQARVLADNVVAELVDRGRWTPDSSLRLFLTRDVMFYPPLDRYVRVAAALVMAVVGFVLLIACANLASFLLARSLDRRGEIAVRLALGASRGNLVAQLATETVLLALLGGALGMVLGSAALRVLVNADLPLPLPLTLDVGLDASVFAFGFSVSLVAGLLFGLLPALDASRTDVAATIRDEATGVGRNGVFSMRGMLVAGQVAVSVVLLVGAGLFLRSFQRTLSVDPGFETDSVATVQIGLPTHAYTDAEARQFVRELLGDLRAMPGVTGVGLASDLPLSTLGWNSLTVTIEGVETPPGRDGHMVDNLAVTPGYLEVMGIPLVGGRDFNDADLAESEPVVIVSQAFVDRYWAGADGVGRRIRIEGREATVVGVATTTKVRSLGEAPRPLIYQPFDQAFAQWFHIVAGTRGDPEALALELLSAARSREPLVWGWQPRSLARHVGVVVLPTRLGAGVISAFAGLALLLAAVGLYGIVSYAVAQRTREVGIRLSLGADAPGMVRLLMAAGLRPVAVGAVAGLALALVGGRFLGSLLFHVQPFDPLAYSGVAAVLVLVSVLAAWAPARKASRVDPMRALRAD